MLQWKVREEESGMKLLPFVKSKLGDAHSSRQLKKEIESNHCLVNGRVERFASAVLGKGDTVSFTQSQTLPACDGDLPSRILYEDNGLLIYDKPAGISSESIDLGKEVELVHRLDRETTGVLIFAKNGDMRQKMMALFKERAINKVYLALVDKVPKAKSGVIENYLGKLKVYQGQTLWGEVSQEKGLYAKTEWFLEKKGEDAALLRCLPETGRTHQIRVHLNSIGHPILGDFQYGKRFQCAYRPNRCLLHAFSISFCHPITGKQMEIQAALPEDFLNALNRVMSS